MADWRTQRSYNLNYTTSFHAYAYGIVCPQGSEQNQGNQMNPGGWAETGLSDLSNYNAGVTQAYYPRTQDGSSPESQEEHPVDAQCHYQSSAVVYLSGPHQAAYGPRDSEGRRAGSESTSDSEPHNSPDSWSSGSSQEGVHPQADPAAWVGKPVNEESSSRSPDTSGVVSSSLLEETPHFAVPGNEGVNNNNNNTAVLQPPLPAENRASSPVGNKPKGKVRAAFSESQMNTLVQRFSFQRYLTPAEMRNLAEATGLTYKQVKTWFQNRRMKLRRHQKDTSWVAERYAVNKDNPLHGGMYPNMPPHMPPFQGEALPQQLREHYNQQMMEAAFKKTAPQNLAFYLAAMGGATGPAGYPSWNPNSSQSPVPNRPHMPGWPMPPGVGHYEYNPGAFNAAGVPAANSTGLSATFDSKEGESISSQSNTGMVPNASQ